MKHLYKPLLKRTAETIIDSVFQRDTDSLHQFAASVQHTRYWQPFEVDSLLPVSRMYKKLDSMPEILLPLGNGMDTTARRSSSVDYYITSRNFFEGQQYYHSAKIGDAGPCRGSLQNDTLLISIGSHMGFGDIGFNIFVARGRFTTMPYYSRCVITDNALKPLNVPLWQKLVLNKADYSIGDSLYGYISFGSIFYDEYGNPSGNKANGFFRTVIKKRDW